MVEQRLQRLWRDARAAASLVAKGCRLLVRAVASATGTGSKELFPEDGWSERGLFATVATGRTDRLRKMLDAGADPNLRHPTGPSLLEAAVKERVVCVVEVLLQYGADPDATRPGQDSALAVAAFRNQRPSATLLLEAGANPILPNPGPLGGTPLSLAVGGGYERLCRIMLDHAEVSPSTLQELANAARRVGDDSLIRTLLAASPKSTTGKPAA